MSNNSTQLKTAVVCMVYNSYEYLSEFLTYYLGLCDHIYIIDHNSERDLRDLKIDRVTFIRSNHEAQFQSECTNTVIEHFGIKNKYDWLFVLDIDEFLPFSDKASFQNFLKKHNKDNVVQLHWRNGVPFYDDKQGAPPSLIDCDSIRFFHLKGRQHKSFVNIKKTKGAFFVPTGSHHISRHLPYWQEKLPIIRNRKIYKAAISDLTLYHIVAFNKDAFIKKIKNYVEQMKYREHIVGQGGWMVRDYPDDFSGDEWLWYIGNFRVSEKDQQYPVSRDDFVETSVFAHLDRSQVIALRDKVLSCRQMVKQKASGDEKKYLEYKKDDRHIAENIKWFSINPENEIVTVVPNH